MEWGVAKDRLRGFSAKVHLLRVASGIFPMFWRLSILIRLYLFLFCLRIA